MINNEKIQICFRQVSEILASCLGSCYLAALVSVFLSHVSYVQWISSCLEYKHPTQYLLCSQYLAEPFKKEGILAENIHNMFSLHEVLAYWQWQLHLTVTYQHLVCHFVKETLSLNIVIYLIVFLYVCHYRSRVMEGNLGFREKESIQITVMNLTRHIQLRGEQWHILL